MSANTPGRGSAGNPPSSPRVRCWSGFAVFLASWNDAEEGSSVSDIRSESAMAQAASTLKKLKQRLGDVGQVPKSISLPCRLNDLSQSKHTCEFVAVAKLVTALEITATGLCLRKVSEVLLPLGAHQLDWTLVETKPWPDSVSRALVHVLMSWGSGQTVGLRVTLSRLVSPTRLLLGKFLGHRSLPSPYQSSAALGFRQHCCAITAQLCRHLQSHYSWILPLSTFQSMFVTFEESRCACAIQSAVSLFFS